MLSMGKLPPLASQLQFHETHLQDLGAVSCIDIQALTTWSWWTCLWHSAFGASWILSRVTVHDSSTKWQFSSRKKMYLQQLSHCIFLIYSLISRISVLSIKIFLSEKYLRFKTDAGTQLYHKTLLLRWLWHEGFSKAILRTYKFSLVFFHASVYSNEDRLS